MERLLRAREAVTEVVLSSIESTGSWSATDPPNMALNAAILISHVLESFLAHVGGDAAGVWEHQRGGWSTPLFVTPTEVWRHLPYGRTLTSEAARIHPGVRHCLEMHPSAAFTVSDLITDRAWQNSDIGRAMRDHWGRNFQLMVPVDAGAASPTFWVWVVGRQRSDFGADDRQVASVLQPVLTAVTRHFAEVERMGPPTERTNSLTPRESNVFHLLVEGRTAGEISARLGISTRTVHKHVERIYRKLGVHDRSSLIASLRN